MMSSVENKAYIKANTVKLKNYKLHRRGGKADLDEIRLLYSMEEENVFQEVTGISFGSKNVLVAEQVYNCLLL